MVPGVPGGAGCLSQLAEEEEDEEEAEGVVEMDRAAFCSPPPGRAWRYGTPAADTTTVALWVDDGVDSWPNSGEVRGGEERRGEEKERIRIKLIRGQGIMEKSMKRSKVRMKENTGGKQMRGKEIKKGKTW